MRKRNIQIIVHLDSAERERLRSRVKKSGLSQEAYIRHLINGYVPTDTPPPDYHAMMNELRAIGVSMNKVASIAHAMNAIDAVKYDEAFAMLKRSLVEIAKAVTSPRKIEMQEMNLPYGTMVLRNSGLAQGDITPGGHRAAGGGSRSELWPSYRSGG